MERTDIENIRQIPLADFLARLGNEPVRRSGNELWYLAPYRSERTPSFRVNVAKQLWYDFGTGKGGDIFTLAGEFARSEDFIEQVKFIAETANMPMPVPDMSKPTFLPKPSEPTFEGVEAAPLFRSPLTDYLAERGIPYSIAFRYCCRLNYDVRGKRYFIMLRQNIQLVRFYIRQSSSRHRHAVQYIRLEFYSQLAGFSKYKRSVERGIMSNEAFCIPYVLPKFFQCLLCFRRSCHHVLRNACERYYIGRNPHLRIYKRTERIRRLPL